MYNEEVKQEYIKECNEKTARDLLVAFKNIGEIEEIYDKDCSCFTASEIISFYKSLGTSSLQYLMVMNYQFERYTNYCLKNNLVPDSQNHYSDIDNAILGECVNKALAESKIITRKQLYADFNSGMILNDSDKCLALALFEGICGQEYCELAYLNTKQIQNGTVVKLCNGRITGISQELRNLMELATAEEEVYLYGSEKTKKYRNGDTNVFKEGVTATDSKVGNELAKRRQQLVRRLHNMQNATGRRAYSKVGLMESGRIDMIKMLMCKGRLDAADTIKKYREDIEYKYGKIPSIPRYLIMYGKYLE